MPRINFLGKTTTKKELQVTTSVSDSIQWCSPALDGRNRNLAVASGPPVQIHRFISNQLLKRLLLLSFFLAKWNPIPLRFRRYSAIVCDLLLLPMSWAVVGGRVSANECRCAPPMAPPTHHRSRGAPEAKAMKSTTEFFNSQSLLMSSCHPIGRHRSRCCCCCVFF